MGIIAMVKQAIEPENQETWKKLREMVRENQLNKKEVDNYIVETAAHTPRVKEAYRYAYVEDNFRQDKGVDATYLVKENGKAHLIITETGKQRAKRIIFNFA